MKIKKYIKNFIIIFGPLIMGTIIGLLVDTKLFKIINKPPLAPPTVTFPIVWTLLYLLMGISLFIVIKNNCDSKTIKHFIIGLIINLIWPILFFSFKLYYISIGWLLLLIYFVVLNISDYYQIKKIASYLQFPYFIWLLIALYLNIGVALLN